MIKEKVTPLQKIHLGIELEYSIKLIKLGLGELQKINGENDFYFLPFLLLSTGYERLMKCMLCFSHFNKYETYPEQNKLRTHDLVKLKDRVINECITEEKANKSQAGKNDLDFLKHNSDLAELLNMFSEFGKYSRYYNLDVVAAAKKPSKDVNQMWEYYELKLIGNDPDLNKLFLKNDLNELYKILNTSIIKSLEFFTRALVRQFTLGDFGDDAAAHIGIYSEFLFLMNSDLGNRKY